MPAEPETLTDLLNKIWALWHIKLVTLQDIAGQIDVDQRSIANWVTQRRRKPDGESFFKLRDFAAMMILKISRRPKLWSKYQTAYRAAGVLFPTKGEK